MSDLVELEILYQGVRLTAAGKRFIVVSPLDDIMATSHFPVDTAKDWRPWKGIVAGSVVVTSVRLGPDGHISNMVMKAKWVRLWESADDRLRWATESRLAEAEYETSKLAGKEVNELHKRLDPIRNLYRSTVGWKRTALLGEIVRYITS